MSKQEEDSNDKAVSSSDDILNRLEVEMRDRFTANDKEYAKYLKDERPMVPPIVEFERTLFNQNRTFNTSQKRFYNDNDQTNNKQRYTDNASHH
jgi:hypothetical protein